MMTSLTTKTSAGPALEQLERLDAQVDRVFLARQHPITGLMPASTANTVHGNYGDAWVRDNVYTVQAIWGLALAWRRQGQRPPISTARPLRPWSEMTNVVAMGLMGGLAVCRPRQRPRRTAKHR